MTVKNFIVSMHEKLVYVSPDGNKYNLHDPAKKAVLKTSGWGMPPADIADTRGPFQHGTDPLTIRIPTREINVNIRHNGCDRDEYWANRMGLINALRLNRTSVNNPSPGKLKWYRSDGTIRQVDCFCVSGPNFNPSRSGWDEHSFTDELRFLCHNPIIYNPTQRNSNFGSLGCSILQQLVFPFSFGSTMLTFGGDICTALNTLTINYVGNWQEFPYITVTGPADNLIIDHVQTGMRLRLLNYDIPAGDSAIFDLRYGKKVVSLSSTSASLLGYISDDSDLGNFAIEPDPVVASGTNDFSVSIDNGNANTQVTFQYYDRYIAI